MYYKYQNITFSYKCINDMNSALKTWGFKHGEPFIVQIIK